VRAAQLRKAGTPAEVALWRHLKGRQLEGYDFHRQKPLDRFIVDFYCHELMLAIEIDGSSHDEKYPADIERQKRLETFGVQFLRFKEHDVLRNPDGVVQSIRETVRRLSDAD
jgi:very-short-patch-repair endonuclease